MTKMEKLIAQYGDARIEYFNYKGDRKREYKLLTSKCLKLQRQIIKQTNEVSNASV